MAILLSNAPRNDGQVLPDEAAGAGHEEIRSHKEVKVTSFKIEIRADLTDSGWECVYTATVKAQVGIETKHMVAEGKSPLAALDAALRKAFGIKEPFKVTADLEKIVGPYFPEYVESFCKGVSS